jgi:hypothetical protein
MSRAWLVRARGGVVAGHGFEIDPGSRAQLADLPGQGLRAQRVGRGQGGM